VNGPGKVVLAAKTEIEKASLYLGVHGFTTGVLKLQGVCNKLEPQVKEMFSADRSGCLDVAVTDSVNILLTLEAS
jgi:hypothetical protein